MSQTSLQLYNTSQSRPQTACKHCVCKCINVCMTYVDFDSIYKLKFLSRILPTASNLNKVSKVQRFENLSCWFKFT